MKLMSMKETFKKIVLVERLGLWRKVFIDMNLGVISNMYETTWLMDNVKYVWNSWINRWYQIHVKQRVNVWVTSNTRETNRWINVWVTSNTREKDIG